MYTKYVKRVSQRWGKNCNYSYTCQRQNGCKSAKVFTYLYSWNKLFSAVSDIYIKLHVLYTRFFSKHSSPACMRRKTKHRICTNWSTCSSVMKNYCITVLISSQTKIETIEEWPPKNNFFSDKCFSVADTHSFPFYSKSIPQLSQIGAYSPR